MPGNLGDGYYTCLVKERATCDGRTYVKEGSVCRDTHWYRAGGKEVLQCTSGLWQWKDEIVTGEQGWFSGHVLYHDALVRMI